MKGRNQLRQARAAVSAILAAVLTAVLAAACSGDSASDSWRELRGQKLEVAAVWSGAELRPFQLVLRAFTRQTGVAITYTSVGYSVPSFLQARLAAHRPPDVAFLPQPELLRTYADEHVLIPLSQIAGSAVDDNYNPVWRQLGSVRGTLYGVWFKAANKSLIWYNEGVFERLGMAPPADISGLLALEHKLVTSGIPAFAVGGGDGWTLADWFSNFYLQLAGPARYDLLAAHRIPWTDPSVTATLRLMARVLDPRVIAGGPRAAIKTSYPQSVSQTFGRQPAAAMVFEGDFVAGAISGKPGATLGVDADVFPFPAAGQAAGPMVVAGGDAAVLMRRSAAGEAFIRFLASPQAAAIWAAQGGFISPNTNLGVSVYPDSITRLIASGLLQAGSNFRFSLSDLAPASFGQTEGHGMRAILQQFLVSRDVGGTAVRLEEAARKAYGP